MQGNLFALLQAENKSITWKSYMWDLPYGDLKFAVNSSMDMLPTMTNLRRWGKRASTVITWQSRCCSMFLSIVNTHWTRDG
jgi:hypothetical protein